MEIHQGFSFEHRFISMKNFTQGQRPQKPENMKSQIFVYKNIWTCQQHNRKIFRFLTHTDNCLWTWKFDLSFGGVKIKTLENSQINLPLPALSHQWWVTPWRGVGGTRPTAAGEKWSNWNTNYDFLRRPPAPLPAPRWDRAAGWLFRCLSIIKWERSLMDNNSTSLGEQFI